MEQLLPVSSLVDFERLHVKPCEGRTLIVGSKIYNDKEDRRKRYPDAVGVDMFEGEGVDVVQNLQDQVRISQNQHFRHVECMSVLEHCERPWLVAANVERMMMQGASIFVSVPFVWRVHGYPNDYWRITPSALPILFPSVRWVKTAFCTQRIEVENKVHGVKLYGHPYFPRTETAGFGYKV